MVGAVGFAPETTDFLSEDVDGVGEVAHAGSVGVFERLVVPARSDFGFGAR